MSDYTQATNSRNRATTTISDSSLYSSLGSVGYQEEVSSGGIGGAFKDAFTDLKDLVWNDRREPVPIYNFFVRGEMGLLDAPCKSVRAFTREYDYEEIQEGGRNDYVILKRKPITHRYTLQLERYVGMDVVDPFALGTEFVAPLLIGVKRILPLTTGFADTMENTELIRLYTFTGCIVTGKEYGQLDAEKSGLLTETVTIAYREMICLTTPNADNVVEHWKITDDDATKKKLKRSSTLLDSWEAVDPTVYKWNVGKDADGVTDLNDPDKRSAQRPAIDDQKAKGKKWNVNLDADKKTKINIPANRSAVRNDDLDEAKAKGKRWGIKEEDRLDANRSAEIPAGDKTEAQGKEWGFREPAKNKSAKSPAGDEKKGKPKMWDVHKSTENKSAKAPAGDTKKAKKKAWDINSRDRNKRAVSPTGDKDSAKNNPWSIKTPDQNRHAVVLKNAADIARFLEQ